MIRDRSKCPPFVCQLHGSVLSTVDEELICPLGHSYTMVDRIPRFVPARTEYTDAFGAQWKRYPKTQLDSYTGSSISETRLRRCLGEELIRYMQESDVSILEAGCGAGRFTEQLLRFPRVWVTATDLSLAVDANLENCGASPRHRVLQADLLQLPFSIESFDLVMCLGVLQHTPDPEASMRALWANVAPGGWFVADHYTRDVAHATKLGSLLLRPLLRRMPGAKGITITEWLTRLFFPLHRAVAPYPILQRVLSRVSPVLTYLQAHPELSLKVQYEWALLDTHDSLTDHFKHFRTVAQVRRSLEELGAVEVAVWRGGNGIEWRCKKLS
jgi:SAM-dependent methyltransferase